MSPTADPYRTLGLAPGAAPDEVKRAYRRLAKLYHPDSSGGAATARFIAIQRAYEALTAGTDRGGAAQRPDPATTRRPAGRRTAPGTRPGASPRQADPDRARAAREGGGSPRERSRRGDRGAPRARPGSTSYDGAEAETFDPEWDGATWYGTASGTYWTINPKEYADPRKHGPEYQARGRRSSSDRADAAGTTPADRPMAEPSGAGSSGDESSGDESSGGESSGSADGAPARPAETSVAGATDPVPAAHELERTPPGEPSRTRLSSALPIQLPERILLAVLGWLVLGLVSANLIGEVSGCARFSATCPQPVGLATILVQPLIVALLLLVPRLAEAAALGTIAVLVAGIPAAVALSALGAATAPAEQAEAGLGLLLAIPYLAAFAACASGRLRVPSPLRGRVR